MIAFSMVALAAASSVLAAEPSLASADTNARAKAAESWARKHGPVKLTAYPSSLS